MGRRRKHKVIEELPEVETYTSDEKASEAKLLAADRLLAGILFRMWLEKRRKSGKHPQEFGAPHAESA